MYLTEVSEAFASVVFLHVGREVAATLAAAAALREAERSSATPEPTLEAWEQHEEAQIRRSDSLTETTRLTLIQARRGQGVFRHNVGHIERACRVTRVARAEHLIAGHIQPWRDSTNEQRLDGENGLLLTPTIDHLFDKGFISFENDGDMIISPVADRTSLARMCIDAARAPSVGSFSLGQQRFLDYHRENVLRMSHR